ncbi:MAG: UDP-N-acetylenolpyruvoylglucosamine reductase [Bacteroidetes bacterium GWF2_33_16]|nr:MAG: UDP-N-acetylenolpyruvoylglucosamine reductase [Bacteroidetes bacterium GWE2_32_14]OFY06443.1 MAG: UDP-N-acetylenolpyruvoylglucosamine reductase [Bacteroidetes bacterium GWF2_33_16]OFZ00001.1 MAG: UDP-N-acetylenolpyruvoylglucosamine reductase [Bacteroidetes bacterium RIFOXYC12_FULL_35_7]
MIEIKEKFSIKKYNTFGFDVTCSYFSTFSTVEELKELIIIHKNNNYPLMVLGGGSNILFTTDYKGLIIQSIIKGVEVISETDQYVDVRVGSGENWDEFVEYCVQHDWSGIENLSLIPGFVGTCPIQNIGAYGVEVKNVINKVETLEIDTLKKHEFTNPECKFGYRDSIFKRDLKSKHIITHVHFRLNKKHEFVLNYGNLKDELQKYDSISLKAIRQAVIDIRNSKLPKPEEMGNAGSFFKNPEISLETFEYVKKSYSDIPFYPQGENRVKIPAGWLIEQSGWKGRSIGNAGVHNKQALVLVNLGNATGNEVLNLAKEIQNSVNQKFGIQLEMEVNVV